MDEIELELCRNVDKVVSSNCQSLPQIPSTMANMLEALIDELRQTPTRFRYHKRRNSEASTVESDRDDISINTALSWPLDGKHDGDASREKHDRPFLPPRKRVKLSSPSGNQNDMILQQSRTSHLAADLPENVNPNINPPGPGPNPRNFFNIIGTESSLKKSLSTDAERNLDVEMDVDMDSDTTNPLTAEYRQASFSPQRNSCPWTSYFPEGGRGGLAGMYPPALTGSFSSHGSHRSHRFMIYEDPDDMEIDDSHFDDSSWYFFPDDDKENTEEDPDDNQPFRTLAEIEPNIRPIPEQRAYHSNYAHEHSFSPYGTASVTGTHHDDPREGYSQRWVDAVWQPSNVGSEAGTGDEEERLTDPDPELRQAGNLEFPRASLNATEVSLHAVPSQPSDTSLESVGRARPRSRLLRPFNIAW